MCSMNNVFSIFNKSFRLQLIKHLTHVISKLQPQGKWEEIRQWMLNLQTFCSNFLPSIFCISSSFLHVFQRNPGIQPEIRFKIWYHKSMIIKIRPANFTEKIIYQGFTRLYLVVSALMELKNLKTLNNILYIKPQMSILCCHFSQKPHHQYWWNLEYTSHIVCCRWFWSNMGWYYP